MTAAEAETADPVPRDAEAFTPKQGQYLAFIYYYTKIHGRPPVAATSSRNWTAFLAAFELTSHSFYTVSART